MINHRMLGALLAINFLVLSGVAQTGKPPVKPPSPAEKPGSQPLKAGELHTYDGVISDGQCASKGSPPEVMKKASVNSAANCVKGCARRHGYVLYKPTSRKIYRLSDQERPAEFANEKVKVKGRLDKATDTIYVSSIERAR